MDKLTSVVKIVGGGGGGGSSNDSTSNNNIGIIEANDSESLCPSLSWKQRLIGCACCIALGMLFSLLSFITIIQMDLVFFSVLFSLGNAVSISGMLFLAGPMTHLKRMFSEGRWIATTVYLISLILTLLAALLLHNALLVLLLCLVQFGAMVWYVLSYIPFARDAVKSCLSGILR